MSYQPQQNFARILTLEHDGQPFECAAVRTGACEIQFTFSLLDEEEEEMVTPAVTMSWPYHEVLDQVFAGGHEDAIKEKALAAWKEVIKALA